MKALTTGVARRAPISKFQELEAARSPDGAKISAAKFAPTGAVKDANTPVGHSLPSPLLHLVLAHY
jgi:hypothetical protein